MIHILGDFVLKIMGYARILFFLMAMLQFFPEHRSVKFVHVMNVLLALNKNAILLLTEWEVSAGVYCPQPFPYCLTYKSQQLH